MSGAAASFMDDLGSSIMKQEDPELVRAGAPAFLLMVDGFLESRPEDDRILLGASKIYSAYTSAFLQGREPERARILSRKARDYAFRAVALRKPAFARLQNAPFREFEPFVDTFTEKDLPLLFQLITAWAGWIQAHSSDWGAVADLAKVKLLSEKLLALDADYFYGSPHLIMGILHTLLPAAMGGRPEEGRAEFEKAIEAGKGLYLQVHVLYAKQYAKQIFDRELHDRLLRHVMDTPADAVPELTLLNVLAKRQAQAMLDSAGEYFD